MSQASQTNITFWISSFSFQGCLSDVMHAAKLLDCWGRLTFLFLTCWRKLFNCCTSWSRPVMSSCLILFSSRCLHNWLPSIKIYQFDEEVFNVGFMVRVVWLPLDHFCQLIGSKHVPVLWSKPLPEVQQIGR